MVDRNMYATKCPVCGKAHVKRKGVNAICTCGSKFYYHDTYWLDRSSGTKYQFTSLLDTHGREIMVSKEAADKLFE